ncbi:MAG: ATP-binding protein [Deltaproteobacteria bacterium]|jgi:hypothetical protein|nr:ATP-binding protein [Deltaproteobacteria bacterium]
MEQKPLIVADSTFKEIILGNQLYADKSEYIHDMRSRFKCCFLSRPRRFGKTLLLDTVSELYQGDRELFRDLWIGAQSDYGFPRHPVLKFNMAYANLKTSDELVSEIKWSLQKQAVKHGVRLNIERSYGGMMEDLLEGIHEKHDVGAVILVDEYDAPVTKNMSDRNLALACRDVLHDFYMSIKTNLEHVSFAFVTGVTRFAMASLDSGANMFKDISIDKRYAGICGFTSREIDALFGDRFEATLESLKENGNLPPSAGLDDLKAKILDWYDGYNWLGNERVFNPYSIFNFFDEKNFRSYWPLTGRPSHLSALGRENPLEFLRPGLGAYPDLRVRNSDLSGIGMVPVMFHSGYLTINEVIPVPSIENNSSTNDKSYTFKPPNKEVGANARADIFIDIFKIEDEYLSALTKRFPSAVLQKNSDEVSSLFHDLLVSVSYRQRPAATRTGQPDVPAENPESEKFYHGILHGSLLSAGFKVQSEAPGGEGRPDITLLLHNDVCVVIELKHLRVGKTALKSGGDGETDRRLAEGAAKDAELSAALDAAEAQIRNMDYAGPSRAAGYKVICLAVAVRGRTEVAARFVET